MYEQKPLQVKVEYGKRDLKEIVKEILIQKFIEISNVGLGGENAQRNV